LQTKPDEQKQEIEKGLAEIVSEDTVEYERVMIKHGGFAKKRVWNLI